jgi:hypothetical protein
VLEYSHLLGKYIHKKTQMLCLHVHVKTDVTRGNYRGQTHYLVTQVNKNINHTKISVVGFFYTQSIEMKP